MFENKELCSKCGGKCCKNMPGAAYPEDFGNDTQAIKKAIKSGKWAIDWWEGDPGDGKPEEAYFVRPAIKGIKEIYHPAWGGECVFLTKKGCSLHPEKRPKNCRLVEPAPDGFCKTHKNVGKQDAALQWRPFYELLNSFGRD